MDLPRILEKRRSVWLTKLVLNGLAQAGAAIATALLVKFIFDHIITATEPFATEALAWSAIGLAVVALFIAWLRMMEYTDAERMGQDYVDQVRMQLFDSLKKLRGAHRTKTQSRRGDVAFHRRLDGIQALGKFGRGASHRGRGEHRGRDLRLILREWDTCARGRRNAAGRWHGGARPRQAHAGSGA